MNIVTNVKVAKDSVLKVINGKIVALCQLNTTDKGKVFTLQDNAPLYHGHGKFYTCVVMPSLNSTVFNTTFCTIVKN